MNHSVQTVKFVAAALIMVGAAVATSIFSAPEDPDWASTIGSQFFPELEDNDETTALRVVGFDEELGAARIFTVKKEGKLWVIPSHHNYPADGADRLKKTAKSLIGIKRGALVSRVASDHERFGVIDPLDEENDSLEGRGQRITLYKEGEIPIADLVIGNSVPDKTDEYYVREAGKVQTFIAALSIDLSTKFRDWVEDDLLKMDRDDLVQLESRQQEIKGREINENVLAVLTREKFSDPWKLDGINDETEEVNKDDLSDMVNVLDNLKLVGIRPRPEGLQGDLSVKLPKNVARDPAAVQIIIRRLQGSLQSKGYFVYEDPGSEELHLFAEAGELIAGLKSGVQYHMAFGNVFTGSEKEIEVGGTNNSDSADSEKSEDDKPKDQKPADPPGSEGEDDASGDDEESKDESKKSRYLFVRCTFNEALLGPALVKPEKPVPPEGVKVDEDGNVIEPEKPKAEDGDSKEEAEGSKDNSDDAKKPEEGSDESKCQDEEKDSTEKPAEEKKDDKPAARDKPDAGDDKPDSKESEEPKEGEAEAGKDKEGEAAPEEKPDPVEEYKTKLAEYRTALSKYETDVVDREEKIKEGKEKVDELNERFADWYYVISAEDFDKLRLTRDQIVKEKEKPETEETEGTEGDEKSTSEDGKETAPDTPGENPNADTKDDADKKAGGDKEKPEAGTEKKSTDEGDSASKPDAGEKKADGKNADAKPDADGQDNKPKTENQESQDESE